MSCLILSEFWDSDDDTSTAIVSVVGSREKPTYTEVRNGWVAQRTWGVEHAPPGHLRQVRAELRDARAVPRRVGRGALRLQPPVLRREAGRVPPPSRQVFSRKLRKRSLVCCFCRRLPSTLIEHEKTENCRLPNYFLGRCAGGIERASHGARSFRKLAAVVLGRCSSGSERQRDCARNFVKNRDTTLALALAPARASSYRYKLRTTDYACACYRSRIALKIQRDGRPTYYVLCSRLLPLAHLPRNTVAPHVTRSRSLRSRIALKIQRHSSYARARYRSRIALRIQRAGRRPPRARREPALGGRTRVPQGVHAEQQRAEPRHRRHQPHRRETAGRRQGASTPPELRKP